MSFVFFMKLLVTNKDRLIDQSYRLHPKKNHAMEIFSATPADKTYDDAEKADLNLKL